MRRKKLTLKQFISLALLSSISFALVACSFLLDTAKVATETLKNEEQVANCNFARDGEWWNASFASLPKDVANNPVTQEPEFCEFYQFSQDYFLYLISDNSEQESNFLDQQQFPLLETKGTNSCDSDYPENAFNIRTVKSASDSSPFVLPERIDQAGAKAIYDQNGNIVFYEIRFSRNLCDYEAIQKNNNFPGKTVELKMAWKVLEAGDDASDFYSMEAEIAGVSDEPISLGLVGWHIVITADNHPEMVWVTVEHQGNTIACRDIPQENVTRSFISPSCAADKGSCQHLNKTVSADQLFGSTQVTDICEVFPYGTVAGQPSDTNDWLNIALLDNLNSEMQAILSASDVPPNLTVWKNYQIKGALWVSNIESPSSDHANQRGSLELANTVMETEFQGTYNETGSATNCFVCHNYSATTKNTATSAHLSHIFGDIINGQTGQ